MDGIVISDLERDASGHWQALVTNGDETFLVSREFGSWQLPELKRDVLPTLASALQARVRPLERAERRS